jgi:hypothetical protein
MIGLLLTGQVGRAAANVLVNNPLADATTRDTQNETSLVVFGDTILIGFNDSGSTIGTNRFTGLSRSVDGGVTFTDMGTLPINAFGDLGDPVLARDTESGRIYFAVLQFPPTNNVSIFRSDDDGATFMPPVTGAPGAPGVQDKPWIAVDNFTGPGQGIVYLAVRDFGPGNGIRFYRSIDDGDTWSPNGGVPIASAGDGHVTGANIVIGVDHTVYVFWFDETSSPERIRMRKSTDVGITFESAMTAATLRTGPGFNGDLGLIGIRQSVATPAPFRTNAYPQAVVNPVTGHLYLIYNDDPVGEDKADILLTISEDGGVTWDSPVRVNDDATTNDQWQPTIAVTPDGRKVGVFWYDRRLDANNNLIDYFGDICAVSGSTVTCGSDFRLTDVSFPPEFGRDPVLISTYMGDYDQAQADNNFFYVAWGDNRDDSIAAPTRKNANIRFAKIPTGTTPPTVSCPIDSTTPTDPDQCFASLSFTVTATGDPTPTVECTVDSTSITSPYDFPLGATVVLCSATNSQGAETCSFHVAVDDVQAPRITCPASSIVEPTTPAGAVVSYPLPTVSDNCSGLITLVSTPPSKSLFPIGVSTVTATTTDEEGNSANCHFTVSVLTPQEVIAALMDQIQDLVTANVLKKGQGNSLTGKLKRALTLLGRENLTAACRPLQAFIRQVNAFSRRGTLTLEQGQALVDSAMHARNALGCDN